MCCTERKFDLLASHRLPHLAQTKVLCSLPMLDYVMSGDFWDHIFEFRGYSLINVWSCTAWCSILGFVGSAALSRGWEATLPAHWYSSGHDWSSLIIPLDVLNYSLQILCVGCTVGPWGLCGTERQCSHSFISGSVKIMRNQHEKKVIVQMW